MPQYVVTDPRTGRVVTITAPRQPTEGDLRYVWSHPDQALPVSLREPDRPVRPPIQTPLSLLSGVTTAPAALPDLIVGDQKLRASPEIRCDDTGRR